MSLAKIDQSVVVVVDLQPTFMAPIVDASAVVRRASFLLQCARLLEVPILATEQYPSRMGGTDPRIAALLDSLRPPFEKMAFGAGESAEFMSVLQGLGRPQIVVVGIEAHICVNQTIWQLLEDGFDVMPAMDAISGRFPEAKAVCAANWRHGGALTTHTESVVYEWLQNAEHPKFRDVLRVVKEFSGALVPA